MTNSPIDPKDIKSFYKYLTPRDLVGNPSVSLLSADGKSKSVDSLPFESIYSVYMSKTTAYSGKTIIDTLKKSGPSDGDTNLNKLSAQGKGALWNTLYQEKGTEITNYLDGDLDLNYWRAGLPHADLEDEVPADKKDVIKIASNKHKGKDDVKNHQRYEFLKQKRDNNKNDKNEPAKYPPLTSYEEKTLADLEVKFGPPSPTPAPTPEKKDVKQPAAAPETTLPPADNFYSQVMGNIGNPKPLVSFSVNVLRTPLLNETSRGANEVEFFLNHIPSYFASNMVPYLDIEFQYPRAIKAVGNKINLDRPSLLRFLVGSEYKLPTNIDEASLNSTLSTTQAADYSLIFNVKTQKRVADHKVGQDPTNPTDTEKRDNRMATFTGMEMFTTPQTLTNMDNLNGGNSGRLNDVRPFLPPASLIGASISIANAGAGMFAHRTASIDMKIHDKNRLVEFSEFFRGPSGNRELIVWLTFGWLAPRTSDAEADYYAKFINENMLTREAYAVKNASYSFDPTGQCSVKLDLVSKGINSAQTTTIDISADEDFKSVARDAAETLQYISENRGIFGDPPEGANQEIRIYQILDSAASGNTIPDFKIEAIQAQIAAANEALNTRKDLSTEAMIKARNVLEKIGKIYGTNGEALSVRLKKSASNFIDKKIKFCEAIDTGNDSPDPFLPDAKKVGANKVYEGYTLYTEELVKHMRDAAGNKDPATKTKAKASPPAKKK